MAKVRKFKAGYEIREELHECPDGSEMTMKSAYTPDGDYIGNSRDAHYLCKKRGIKPEKAEGSHNVCSIGFCEKEEKWYGWSHRAIFGFGVGHVTKDGDCQAETIPIGFRAKTIEDCRKLAVAFASSVS